MRKRTQGEALALISIVLKEPTTYVLAALSEDTTSSLQLAPVVGVPASTLRALRNGRQADMTAETWAKLATWALGQDGVPL